MKKVNKVEIAIPLLTILADCVAVLTTYIISYNVRFFSPFTDYFPVRQGLPELSEYVIFALITIPIWLLVFQSYKMYRLNRAVFIFDEFSDIVKVVTISTVFTMAFVFFYREYPFSRMVFVINWFIAVFLVTVLRYLVLKLEKTLYNNKIGLKRVAMIGCNHLSKKICEKLKRDTFTGLNIVGYFTKSGDQCSLFGDLKNFGDYASLPEKIRKNKIDKIIVALETRETGDVYQLMEFCQGINVEFMLAPDYLDIVTSKLRVEEIDGIPLMKLKSVPLNVWNRFVKRTFDIVCSVMLLILFFPLMFIISVGIKLTSKGPLFYKQERVGLDGEKFMMIKFRSMKIDAEKDGPQFADKDDDRYTTIGRTLRKYSLDELPQFINVLKGDMSMVGPRPEREFFIEQLKGEVENFLERHRVKAGVTGWAQVNGLRGSQTSYQTRIEYDIYYIENWSLAFDIKIIFKTFKEMLFSKEAF